MFRMLKSCLAIALAGASVECAASSAGVKPSDSTSFSSHQVGSTCLPPYWGGILAGSSTDREVIKLYGEGFRTERQGTDVRLFTDLKRASTVVVQFGTDSIVESLTVWGRLEPGLDEPTVEKMVSPWLERQDPFGGWGSIHFGDSPQQVRENMGEPIHVWNDGDLLVWVYNSVCACALETGLSFRFNGGGLLAFEIWAAGG